MVVTLMDIDEKLKATAKDYKVMIQRASEVEDNPTVIPTGSLAIDAAIGGGLPAGKIIELYGLEDVGKSTLGLSLIGEALKLGFGAAYIDVERSFDRDYAAAIIGEDNLERLYYVKGDTSEQLLDVTSVIIKSGAVKVVVLDSVAALVPNSFMEGNLGEERLGMRAALISLALPRIATAADDNGVLVLLINQMRTTINRQFTKLESPGGKAMRHYPSIRMYMSASNSESDETKRVVKFEVVKAKYKIPRCVVETSIIHSEGFDVMSELITLGVSKGIITKKASWYYYGELRLGQGEDNVKKVLSENVDLYNEIYRRTLSD